MGRKLAHAIDTRTGNGGLPAFLLHSRLFAKLFPFRKPAILLLSYPRSGSSWAGKVLGLSPDVAYLREPINQGYQNHFKDGRPEESVVDPLRDQFTRNLYMRLSDDAFLGIPPKAVADVIEDVADFSPQRRRTKRLLIKEINPLSAEFLVKRHAPTVVILLRHPAAVADSYNRLGWLGGKFQEFGHEYGRDLAKAVAAIKSSTHTIVRHEDLANHPKDGFGRLFAALGIRPPANFDNIIHEFCETPAARVDPYEIRRASRSEAEKWRQNLNADAIQAVFKGYRSSGLEYYRDETEW